MLVVPRQQGIVPVCMFVARSEGRCRNAAIVERCLMRKRIQGEDKTH